MDASPSRRRFYEIPLVLPSVILGAAFILCALIGGRTILAVRSFSNTISVTGSAQQVIVSDVARWRIALVRTVDIASLPSGYAQIKSDLTTLQAYLRRSGIDAKDVVIAPVNVNTLSGKGGDYSTPSSYQLAQNVEVTSKDVERLTKIAQDSSVLLSQGALVSTASLEYSYSKLADLKVDMLAEATKNAQQRADRIARSAGASLGSIRAADMGVIQVMAENSVDVSDYGTFDTASIRKQVTAVVRATFGVR